MRKILGGLVIAVLIVGCGGAASPQAPAAPSAAPTQGTASTSAPVATASATPSASGAFGGIVHYQLDGAPASTEIDAGTSRVTPSLARPSAAAGGAPAVQALVAAAVADHDRAAFGARWGIRLGLEADLRRSKAHRECAPAIAPATVALGLAVAVRRVAVGVTVGGDDRQLFPGSCLGRGPLRR